MTFWSKFWWVDCCICVTYCALRWGTQSGAGVSRISCICIITAASLSDDFRRLLFITCSDYVHILWITKSVRLINFFPPKECIPNIASKLINRIRAMIKAHCLLICSPIMQFLMHFKSLSSSSYFENTLFYKVKLQNNYTLTHVFVSYFGKGL